MNPKPHRWAVPTSKRDVAPEMLNQEAMLE